MLIHEAITAQYKFLTPCRAATNSLRFSRSAASLRRALQLTTRCSAPFSYFFLGCPWRAEIQYGGFFNHVIRGFPVSVFFFFCFNYAIVFFNSFWGMLSAVLQMYIKNERNSLKENMKTKKTRIIRRNFAGRQGAITHLIVSMGMWDMFDIFLASFPLSLPISKSSLSNSWANKK